MRWLGGRGIGLVPVTDAASFSWAGPWIGWVRSAAGRRAVVMYGVPSGLAWDPAGIDELDDGQPESGFVVAALDIALALPPTAQAPTTTGSVEAIYVAAEAGRAAQSVDAARAVPDRGLEGDRHLTGVGTFPSGLPGSALTLIQSEVCESFQPPLSADEPWSATSFSLVRFAAAACDCVSPARSSRGTPPDRCCGRWSVAVGCGPTS